MSSRSSARPRVGISRCLLGDLVRYDGGHKRELALIDQLGSLVEWVPVCPEIEVGMAVPREPIELVTAHSCAGIRVVGVRSGEDWTDRMRTWATRRLEDLCQLGLSGFVLKARSPSCGPHHVPIRGGPVGRGVFADMLMTAMPDLPVEEEERLRDAQIRAEFVDRVRAYDACGGRSA